MADTKELALTAMLEAAEKERDNVAQRLADSECELTRFKKAWRTQRENIKSIARDRRKITEERDALRAELSKQQALTGAAQHIAEVAQNRANQLQAKIAQSIPDDVMRDARRYMWLRNSALDWYVGPEYSTYNDVVCAGVCCNLAGGGVALDSAIDDLLATTQEAKP